VSTPDRDRADRGDALIVGRLPVGLLRLVLLSAG
jgi:hypothetical protein